MIQRSEAVSTNLCICIAPFATKAGRVSALVSCAVLHLVLARDRDRRGVDERPLRSAIEYEN